MAEDSLFRILFENMTSGAAVYEVRNEGLLGKDYIVKDFNRISCEIEGISKKEAIGKSLFELRPTIDDYGLIEVFRQVWKTGEPAYLPAKKYVDENYVSWYENHVFRLPGGEIVSVYNDVTENELRNQELNEKNKLLMTLIEDSPYGVFITDETATYITVNKKACEQTGYSKEELEGSPLSMVVPKGDPYNGIESFKRLVQSGYINENHRFITKSGELKLWNINAVRIDYKTYVGFTNDITEEEKLREQISAKAEEYQALFDNAALGIGYYTKEGKVIWYNKVAAVNMGGKPEDFIGKTIHDLFPKQAADIYKRRLGDAVATNDRVSYEDELELPVGNVTFYSTYNCIHDRNGQIIGVQIISQDVSEIKKAEKTIAEKQREYKVLFEEAPLGYQSLDIDGNIIAVNNAWLGILGYSREEVIGKKFSGFLHPEYVHFFHENFPDFKKAGSSCAVFGMIKKTGEYITIRFDGNIIYDDEGAFVKTQCMLQDITHAMAMEQKLKESEKKFRNMFEEAPMAYQSIDGNGIFLDVNKAWVEISGYEKQEIIGSQIMDIIVPEDRKSFEKAFVKLKKKGKYEIETEVIRKDGSRIFVKANSRSIYDSEGNFVRTVDIVRDITARKKLETENIKMEAQLRNQQKLESIGVLAGGVAHEINNPINGIMNYGQLILDSLGEKSECSEYAREIIHESERVAAIVRDLLQFSSRQKQSFRQTNIEEIIKHTITLIRTIMKNDQIGLSVEIEKDLPEIQCRSQQIQQVLMNLLTNARDALNERYEGYHEDKKIDLECSSFTKGKKCWIRISVKDRGNGVPEHIRDNIFDPFFTTKRRDEGSGIGLSISYGIIRDHKGEIYFNTKEGEGTEFIVELPAAE